MKSKHQMKARNSKIAEAAWSIPFIKLVLVDSRLLFIASIQLIANLLIPDHDADAFRSAEETSPGVLDNFVQFLFGGFTHWDATHFLHIAQWGYTFENNLAFFPLYPIITGCFWKTLALLIPESVISITSGLLLSGVLVNMVCFTGAAYMLFLLTYSTHADVKMAPVAVVLFAVNPASVFFSCCYSESLYAFLTFLALYSLHARSNKNGCEEGAPVSGLLEASVIFGLALLCRSNGLLNFIFIGFALLQRLVAKFTLLNSVYTGNYAAMCAVIILTPYICLQLFIYKTFCTSKIVIDKSIADIARNNNYTLPGQLHMLPWCSSIIPLSYSHVQAQYWDVGFLKYFQIRKIPCFLLAAPIIVLAYSAIIHYLAKIRPPSNVTWYRHWFGTKNEDSKDIPAFYLPYILHASIVMFTGIFFINVEVVTRLILSSNPLIYWYVAEMICKNLEQNGVKRCTLLEWVRTKRLCTIVGLVWSHLTCTSCKLILVYFVGYAVLGTVLHSNFYPWV